MAAVGCHADHPVGDHADDPQPALDVEGQAVGKGAGSILGDQLTPSEGTVVVNTKSRRAPGEGLVHVKPFARGVENRLVGIAQILGDNPPTAASHQHDTAVPDIRAVGARPWFEPGADRDPDTVQAIPRHEVTGRQAPALHLEQERLLAAVAGDPPNAAGRQQVGAKEVPLGGQGKAIGSDHRIARPEQIRLAPIPIQTRDAAAEVRDVERPGGGRDDTFRAHEGPADLVELLGRKREVLQAHDFNNTQVRGTAQALSGPAVRHGCSADPNGAWFEEPRKSCPAKPEQRSMVRLEGLEPPRAYAH